MIPYSFSSRKYNHWLHLHTHQAEFEQRSVAAVFLDGESLNRGLKVKQDGVWPERKQRDLGGVNLQNHGQPREHVGKL